MRFPSASLSKLRVTSILFGSSSAIETWKGMRRLGREGKEERRGGEEGGSGEDGREGNGGGYLHHAIIISGRNDNLLLYSAIAFFLFDFHLLFHRFPSESIILGSNRREGWRRWSEGGGSGRGGRGGGGKLHLLLLLHLLFLFASIRVLVLVLVFVMMMVSLLMLVGLHLLNKKSYVARRERTGGGEGSIRKKANPEERKENGKENEEKRSEGGMERWRGRWRWWPDSSPTLIFFRPFPRFLERKKFDGIMIAPTKQKYIYIQIKKRYMYNDKKGRARGRRRRKTLVHVAQKEDASTKMPIRKISPISKLPQSIKYEEWSITM